MKIEDLLESVDGALADLVDSVDSKETVEALRGIAAALKQLGSASPPTVTVNPAIQVSAPQKPAWNTLRITPERDPLTGDAKSFVIQRIN